MMHGLVVCRELQSWWIVVARFLSFGLSVLFVYLWAIFRQSNLLVTRLDLMPCSEQKKASTFDGRLWQEFEQT